MSKKVILITACVSLILSFTKTASAAVPKNVIFMIGDGMGFEQVKAANYYNGGDLPFESLPYQAEVTTYSADSAVTDSAAAGTAMATGQKVIYRIINYTWVRFSYQSL